MSERRRLVDFPKYEIDMATGVVYRDGHGLSHWGEKEGKQWQYALIDANGKARTVGIGRLMASAQYGCSYYQLPKDVMFNWTQASGITMRSREECGKMSYQTVIRRQQATDRMQVLERTQKEIALIKKAYQGDLEPLTQYLYSKREHYLKLVQRSRLSAGLAGGGKILQEIIDDIISELILNVVSGIRNILMMEPYIVRRSIVEVRRRKSEMMKRKEYDDSRISQ